MKVFWGNQPVVSDSFRTWERGILATGSGPFGVDAGRLVSRREVQTQRVSVSIVAKAQAMLSSKALPNYSNRTIHQARDEAIKASHLFRQRTTTMPKHLLLHLNNKVLVNPWTSLQLPCASSPPRTCLWSSCGDSLPPLQVSID